MGLFYTPKSEPKRWQYRTTYILTRGTDSDHPKSVNTHLDRLGSNGWELIQIVDGPWIDGTGRPLKMAYFKRELLPKPKQRWWFDRPFSGVWEDWEEDRPFAGVSEDSEDWEDWEEGQGVSSKDD